MKNRREKIKTQRRLPKARMVTDLLLESLLQPVWLRLLEVGRRVPLGLLLWFMLYLSGYGLVSAEEVSMQIFQPGPDLSR